MSPDCLEAERRILDGETVSPEHLAGCAACRSLMSAQEGARRLGRSEVPPVPELDWWGTIRRRRRARAVSAALASAAAGLVLVLWPFVGGRQAPTAPPAPVAAGPAGDDDHGDNDVDAPFGALATWVSIPESDGLGGDASDDFDLPTDLEDEP